MSHNQCSVKKAEVLSICHSCVPSFALKFVSFVNIITISCVLILYFRLNFSSDIPVFQNSFSFRLCVCVCATTFSLAQYVYLISLFIQQTNRNYKYDIDCGFVVCVRNILFQHYDQRRGYTQFLIKQDKKRLGILIIEMCHSMLFYFVSFLLSLNFMISHNIAGTE